MEIEVEREREREREREKSERDRDRGRERGKIKPSHEQVLQPATTRVKRESNYTKMIPLDKVVLLQPSRQLRRAR